MKVRVNCPIAGCGVQINAIHLARHFEKVHKLDGELVLRLHPGNAYQHTPEDDQEPGEEPKPEEEAEPEKDQEPGEEAEPEKDQEPEEEE
ncbi:hypothetical protein ES706_06154 [subsurface metagenome]